MLWLSRVLPSIVCLQAAIRGWLARRDRACARAQSGSSSEAFGAFIGRWAPAKRCAYGRLEWAYFFPEAEGEHLFMRVLALGLGLSFFAACFVTGMLLGLSAADRALLHDERQLEFTADECVQVKQEHSARSIQRLGDALEQLQVEVALEATAPRTRSKRGHHGSRANRRALMLTTMLGVAGATPRDGYSAQVSTVQYPRASLYEGLPVDFFETVDELMHNRLSPSSMLKVNIAFERYWKPVAAANGWDEIITTDDPERGGKMATFVLHMLDNTALVADSIGTYVWALRWKMKLSHQADPVLGVMHWQDFMRSVRVKSHVPHEPRRAVPLRLILAIIASIDVTVYWEVQFAFL
eukprot:jgi/Chrpa1/24997/Chrysochromulina_OHIO_Genome00025755-RA